MGERRAASTETFCPSDKPSSPSVGSLPQLVPDTNLGPPWDTAAFILGRLVCETVLSAADRSQRTMIRACRQSTSPMRNSKRLQRRCAG